MIYDLPILGICSYSGSGKTTLIEQIVPELCRQELKIAVIKHDVHGIDVDRPGKDSYRFFQAGADVLLQGPGEELFRVHAPDGENELMGALRSLAERYDLILVEGHKATPLHKVWLLGGEEVAPPADVEKVVAVLARDCDRLGAILPILENFLKEQWLKTPVLGCVPIGGKSIRMGTPKHLLLNGGKTWLERTVELLRPVCQRVVIVGTGKVPEGLADCVRLHDVPDADGPMAGLLAAMRWAPQASWLVAACDMPELSAAALDWLLSTRAPGIWATLPRLAGSGGVEPLLAHYDFRCRPLLEQQAACGNFKLSGVAIHPKVVSLTVPSSLAAAWRNVNAQADLRSETR